MILLRHYVFEVQHAQEGRQRAPVVVGGGKSSVGGKQGGAAACAVSRGAQRQPATSVGTHDCGVRRANRRGAPDGVVSGGSGTAAGERNGERASAVE